MPTSLALTTVEAKDDAKAFEQSLFRLIILILLALLSAPKFGAMATGKEAARNGFSLVWVVSIGVRMLLSNKDAEEM